MKKIISIVLIVCALAVCVTSCASLDSYEKNLGDDYDVDRYNEDEIEELAEIFDIDLDDYDIDAVMEAKHEDKGYYAYIIKCGSKGKAKDLEKDLEDVVDAMNAYYSFEVKAVVDGKFVLIGHEDVVDKALDK